MQLSIKIVLVVILGLPYFYCSNAQVNPTRVIVSLDGKGDFVSVQEAIRSCKAFPDHRITIFIKPGIYHEKVEVFSQNTKISLIGEDAATTIIQYDDYSGKGSLTTFSSYSVKISGDDFYAENITFENSAGPVGQAVAMHIEADRCVFRNCRFIGNQDTIYTGKESNRQYFTGCYIEGTTDFIFGPATAVFENCIIHSKKNSYITAASTSEGKVFGYVFIKCDLTCEKGTDKVYLGRPWRSFAKTVFLNCTLGNHIVPEGWHNWSKRDAELTTYYAEYKSVGPGAKVEKRVTWSHQLTRAQARAYTVTNILAGQDEWNPNVKGGKD